MLLSRLSLKSRKGVNSLDKFFHPSSVAVIGASRDPRKFGHAILKNFAEKFKGPVYPINPKANEVLGKKCYPSIKSVPGRVDLAVVVVPPEIANQAVRECVEKKVPAVVVITAGYREIGGEGLLREQELTELITLARGRTRVVGPNVMGVFDPYGGVDTLFQSDYKMKRPEPGKVGFISQSGAFGIAVLDWAATEGIGISRFVSYGNAADVDEVDLLNYFARDKQTSAILLYVEGVKDGRRFLSALKEATKVKPVVVFKAGKSEAGIKAAASHTGTLAGSYDVFRAAIKQGGAIEARTVEQMFDLARAMAYQPKAKGPRVAVVTNGGGFGVICSDACVREGLVLADISKSAEEIAKVLPSYATIHNPLDLIGDADAKRYAIALNALMNDPEVDGIICITLPQTTTLEPDIVETISAAVETKKKPLLVVAAGGDYTNLLMRSLEKEGVPAYQTPERAAKAMAALAGIVR